MKVIIHHIKRFSILCGIIILFSVSKNLYSQSCGSCNGQKTTCGLPGCDLACDDCEGPDIPVDNGVWLLISAGGLVMLYFAAKKMRQMQSVNS
jgi:hypothetical protein